MIGSSASEESHSSSMFTRVTALILWPGLKKSMTTAKNRRSAQTMKQKL